MYDINSQIASAKQIAQANNQFSSDQAEKQMAFQRSMFNQGNAFNAQEAQKQRSWEEYMSNTAHRREMKDLIAAGLNPVLAANNGASTPSGSSASSLSAPVGAKAEFDSSANSAISSLFGAAMNYQAVTDAARTNALASQRVAQIQAEASRYASSASMYNAALAASASRANNAAQIASQKRLAEYDFEKQMNYRKFDRDTMNMEYDRRLYNDEYMALNYPTTPSQAVNALAMKHSNNVSNILDKIGNFFKDWFHDIRNNNVSYVMKQYKRYNS